MSFTQYEGHFESSSIQAATWPNNHFVIIMLSTDAGLEQAQQIAGPHGIIVNSKSVANTLQHDDMIARLLTTDEIAARAPEFLDQGAPVQPTAKPKPQYIKLEPHHVFAVFDGWMDALKAASGETSRVDYAPTETGFTLTITPMGGEPIVIEALDQTRDRIAPMW